MIELCSTQKVEQYKNIIPDESTSDTIEALLSRGELKQLIECSHLTNYDKFVLGLRFGIATDFIGDFTLPTEQGIIRYSEALSQNDQNQTRYRQYGGLTLGEIAKMTHSYEQHILYAQRRALIALGKTVRLFTLWQGAK